MKSKATTYLLIAVVIIVWGIIGWRIFSPKDDAAQSPPAPKKTGVAAKAADTLVLNYRDPFLGAAAQPKKAAAKPPRTPQTAAPKPPPEPAVVHNLRYMGRIMRDKAAYGLVEIGGTLNTMKTGEMVEGYKLVKLYDDSVQLVWKGKTITVVRQH